MTPKYQVDQKVITPLGIGRIVDIGLETFSFFYLSISRTPTAIRSASEKHCGFRIPASCRTRIE